MTGPAQLDRWQSREISAELGRQFLAYVDSVAHDDLVASFPDWRDLLSGREEGLSNITRSIWAAVSQSQTGALRIRNEVLVARKTLVMQVYLDTDENYTVRGYAARMDKSFGRVYLGLDSGIQYDSESHDANRAIMAITADYAFAEAFAATQAVLSALAGASRVDVGEVSSRVLAAVCQKWFDLPGDANMVVGGMSFNLRPPARLPGNFATPSGYIFQPHPRVELTFLGRLQGASILKPVILDFVERHRRPGQAPTGVVSAALFAAFPSPAQNDLLSRTIIGVLMGMLPTVDGSLNTTVKSWLDDGSFDAVRSAFLADPTPDLYTRACRVLTIPLMTAMQKEPVPDAVWRTALKDHHLGHPPISVRAGDVINISISSATRADLSQGILDVSPIFGGVRTPPHGTHACPGRPAAMGLLLGIISGILLDTTPRPLSVDTTNIQM